MQRQKNIHSCLSTQFHTFSGSSIPLLMEAASLFAQLNSFPQSSASGHRTSIRRIPRSFTNEHFRPKFFGPRRNSGSCLQRIKTSYPVYSAATEFSGFTSDPAQAVITWQIVVGSLAGITPFVVAGIEFSKRIIKQRQCEVCKGSGLVLRADKQYKCPGCGGWLPWLSWRRFFTG